MVGGDRWVVEYDHLLRRGVSIFETAVPTGGFNHGLRPGFSATDYRSKSAETCVRLALGLLAWSGRVSFDLVRILDRYILAEWAKVFALALLSFVGLMLLSDGYNRIPEFLALDAGWGAIIAYLLLGLVRNLSLLIPISLLISVIFVLATMNRNQEIAAVRAAGIGMGRLTAPLWAVGGLLAGLIMLLNAVLVPDALEAMNAIQEEAQFAALKAKGGNAIPRGQASSVSFENSKARRLWLVSNLGLSTGQAFEVVVHAFDANQREVRRISARFAEFRKTPEGWSWTFRDGRDLRFDPATGSLMAQPRFAELTPGFNDDPEVMFYSTKEPAKLSLREVSRFVDQAGSNPGGPNAAYAMRYHAIMSVPVICLIVIAVAIPFSVVSGRVSPMVGVAKTFGLFLAFYFLTSFCSAFGESGALPPMIAAWIPTTLVACWALPKLKSVN
jgi:LPS export ABC transporter permease LptG